MLVSHVQLNKKVSLQAHTRDLMLVIEQSAASGSIWTDVRTNVSTSHTNCRRSASDPDMRTAKAIS